MGSESVSVRSNHTNPVLVALSSYRRRLVLATLAEEGSAVSVPELATHVAAGVRDASFVGVDGDERQHERVGLVHRELPKLEAADLVEWDRDAGVVSASDYPALAESGLSRVVESPGDDWDAVLESLAHDRRRVVLSVLVDHGSAIGRRNLARRTAAREQSVPADSVSPDDVDDVAASLHHVHLPKLREADLLVDDDQDTIRYAGHPSLDEDSFVVDSSDVVPPMAPVTQ